MTNSLFYPLAFNGNSFQFYSIFFYCTTNLFLFLLGAELSPPNCQDSQTERLALPIRNMCWCIAIKIETLSQVSKAVHSSPLPRQWTDDSLDLSSTCNANSCKTIGRWQEDQPLRKLPFPHRLLSVPRLVLYPSAQSVTTFGVRIHFLLGHFLRQNPHFSKSIVFIRYVA
jgi:hypothetical protein